MNNVNWSKSVKCVGPMGGPILTSALQSTVQGGTQWKYWMDLVPLMYVYNCIMHNYQ